MGRPSDATVAENKEKFLEIYPKVGTVLAAAKELGVSRQAIHVWLKDDDFLNADYLFQKYINVEKMLGRVNAIACGEVEKPAMVELAAQQYLLGTFLSKVFSRYKEKREEGKKISKMVVRKDKGNGKIETEEYEFKEMTENVES